MLEQTHRDIDHPPLVAVDVENLEYVVERIFSAGVLLNGRLDGPQLSERVEAVTGELDAALRAIQLMALRTRARSRDLDQLVVTLAEAADDVSELAGEQRHDGPGHYLDEAARHLHRARMCLGEAQEKSRPV